MPRSSRTKSHEGTELDDAGEHAGENETQTADNSSSKASGPRRSKRNKVMSESVQTDAERRELRIQQRSLKSRLMSTSSQLSEQIADVNTDKFQKTRDDNNKLFEDVRYTREAVLDADNLELIANRAARQVDKLISVPRYDVEKFILKLKRSCSEATGDSGSSFQWYTFGYQAGSCFNTSPSNVSFLNGPIDEAYEPKQRKKAERRKRENMDHVEMEEVGSVQQKKRSKDEDKLSAAEKQVTKMEKLIVHKSQENSNKRYKKYSEKWNKDKEDWNQEEKQEFKSLNKDKGEVDGVQFLFNPNSFTQTVENLFSLSFLVKKGSAKLGVRKPDDCKANSELMQPGFFIKAKGNDEPKIVPPTKQAIISLSMADWRAMVAAHGVESSDVPHRNSKYAKKKIKK